MIDTVAPYRSTLPAGRDSLSHLLRAEWTKFRSVRGWVIGTVVAAVLMMLFGLLVGAGGHSAVGPDGKTADAGRPPIPTGPGGEPITDSFFYVHQPLAGDGTITVRVTSLTGAVIEPHGGGPGGPGGDPQGAPDAAPTGDPEPWSKAGLLIKENTSPGSAYAAIMVTGGHGVRMQHNFTEDTAGPAGAVSAGSPRWLRLTRSGDTVTGYASTDGSTWVTVGTAELAGLSATAQIGLFVASPPHQDFEQHFGGNGTNGMESVASATFDGVDLSGQPAGGTWKGEDVGVDPSGKPVEGHFATSAGTYTLVGNGDIAPDVSGSNTPGGSVGRTLTGAFATLTVLVVLGVLFITTEYRRGLIRTSFAASPRRGRVLAAKAVVAGAVAFVTGLVAAVITIPLSQSLLRSNGTLITPVPWLTEVRVVVGTAALVAVAAVLAVALGAIMRRSVGAVTAVIVLTALPYILSVSAVLPAGAAQWLLRLTPAAGFAIQQSVPAYPQVDQAYTPTFGFFPLAPWAGFAVLCGWTAAALGLAAYLLRRRDA